jgi:hypothetical protein
VVLVDALSGATQPMSAAGSGYLGAWSRDGSRALIARRSATTAGREAEFEIAALPWDRSGGETILARGIPRRVTQLSITPAASLVATAATVGLFGSEVFVGPMDSIGAPPPFASGRSQTHWAPALSADGRLLAWSSNESGPYEVYVTPVPGPGPRLQVSVGGGNEPVWSKSGSTLFFRGPVRMTSAEIAPSPLRVVRLDSLFADSYMLSAGSGSQNWDVFPGAREFLMVRQESTQDALPQVLLNWPQLLSKRAGVAPER